MTIVELDHVSKLFRTRRGPRALLGRHGLGGILRRRPVETFTALDDISFRIDPGESVGLIGRNGSGKSTLLKIVAGVTEPTTGSVVVRGRVASLLELGAGFHPMLTGRENVYLNAGILGMRHAQVDAVFDRIVEFAGIGPFIDRPVDTYSSGMYVRLAFAVAVHVDPDLFLVDEVLAVGDEEFQRKCRRRIGELRDQGKTILFVSHDLGIVNTLCDRVVLLDRGRMLVRDTPRDAIDFYLRTVGGAEGVAVLNGDGSEAVFSHGRISLFRDGREVCAPSGFQLSLRSMDQDHPASAAAWEVVATGPGACTARGVMPRLPVTHVWEIRLEEGRLRWRMSLEVDREVPLESFDAFLHFPAAYLEWLYGDLAGRFPEILPQDVTWHQVVAPEVSCRETAALPGPDSPRPPVHVALVDPRPYQRLLWTNSDYVTGTRVLAAGGRLPDAEARLAPGRHELLTLEIDPRLDAAGVRGRIRTDRTVHGPALCALFEHGRLRLSRDDEELTAYLHGYTSMLIDDLWNDSLNLQWSLARREGDELLVTGASRRFPFRQHWTISPAPDGLIWRVRLEVLEPFDAQEFHASIVLRPEYIRWRTDHEEGEFPPTDPADESWRHVNRTYAPGRRATALSPVLPCVTLEADADAAPFRMTVVMTGHSQNARVLQALRTPEFGLLHYEPGMHPYFDGRIVVNAHENSGVVP